MNYMTKHEQSGFALRPTSFRMREACAHPFRANSQVLSRSPLRSGPATRLVCTLKAPSTRAAGQLDPWDTGYIGVPSLVQRRSSTVHLAQRSTFI